MNHPGKDLGGELRGMRLAAGLSLRALAARIHYSRGYLSKVENMRMPASAQLVRLYDAALGANGRLIAQAIPPPVQIPAGGAEFGDAWIIRLELAGPSFFALGSGAPGPGVGPSAPRGWPPPEAGRAQAEAAAALSRDWFGQLRALGRQADAGILLPTLIAQVHTLRALAASAPGALRSRVIQLAARYAEFTGWMAQEAGDDRGALWWTDLAASLARTCGDPAMAGHVQVRRALVALYQGNGALTADLARLAQRQPGLPAREQGLAALREAQGLALAGDYDSCRRALDRGQAHLAAASPAPEGQGTGRAAPGLPALGPSTVADPVQMATGWCLHDLGRPADAAAVLDREVARMPAHAPREYARYQARRALAHAAAGEVDHACVLTGALIPAAAEVASATVRHDLRQLARTLHRWPTRPAVQEILPDLVRLARIPAISVNSRD